MFVVFPLASTTTSPCLFDRCQTLVLRIGGRTIAENGNIAGRTNLIHLIEGNTAMSDSIALFLISIFVLITFLSPIFILFLYAGRKGGGGHGGGGYSGGGGDGGGGGGGCGGGGDGG
jgi:uncharacterized membrane protein YgcG